mmetsp:Transcript_47100/g.64142  ORF Transcript_47100/g.64142 Transcript_47100/m.64142 type:complete len:288 (-) Transcript_47100:168-1031(-)
MLVSWTVAVGMEGRVLVIVDHGLLPVSVMYEGILVVVFAGTSFTADDVIANDVPWLARRRREESYHACPVFVVTSDRELQQRCLKRYGKRCGRVRLMNSQHFLELVEEVCHDAPSLSLNGYSHFGSLHRAEKFLERYVTVAAGGTVHPVESSWQRVLSAEIFRRLLMGRCDTDLAHSPSTAVDANQSDASQNVRSGNYFLRCDPAANFMRSQFVGQYLTRPVNLHNNKSAKESASVLTDHRIVTGEKARGISEFISRQRESQRLVGGATASDESVIEDWISAQATVQ